MNSTMRPIFNEKVAKKWNLWVHEQYTDALFTMEKSTNAATVYKQCMNSSHITPWNAWKPKKEKKKKKENVELQNANAIISIQTGTKLTCRIVFAHGGRLVFEWL